MAYGVSIALDACIHEVEIDAEASRRFVAEAVRAMRCGHDPQAIWGSVGGRIGFPAASVLLALVCQHQGGLGPIRNLWATGGSKTRVERCLRALWEVFGETSRPPQGRGFSEQLADELGNALPKLSQKSTPHWKSLTLFTPGPLAHGVPGRVGLLRGYGNGVNPYQTKEFICAFREGIQDMRAAA